MAQTYNRTVWWAEQGVSPGGRINTSSGSARTDFKSKETRYIAHKTQLSLQLESGFSICGTTFISQKLMAFRVKDKENVPLRGTTGLQKTSTRASCKALRAEHSEGQDAREVLSHPSRSPLSRQIPGKYSLLVIDMLASIESSHKDVILRKTETEVYQFKPLTSQVRGIRR